MKGKCRFAPWIRTLYFLGFKVGHWQNSVVVSTTWQEQSRTCETGSNFKTIPSWTRPSRSATRLVIFARRKTLKRWWVLWTPSSTKSIFTCIEIVDFNAIFHRSRYPPRSRSERFPNCYKVLISFRFKNVFLDQVEELKFAQTTIAHNYLGNSLRLLKNKQLQWKTGFFSNKSYDMLWSIIKYFNGSSASSL